MPVPRKYITYYWQDASSTEIYHLLLAGCQFHKNISPTTGRMPVPPTT
ncbi:MAG: hypothetical protein F6K41_32010 [Symploca sp. SIO3E6]|nr:hypothetical protein [Caldora sp. SIO3E6]